MCLCAPMVAIIAVSAATNKGVLFKVRWVKLLVTSNFIHLN